MPAPPGDSPQQEEALFRALLHRVQSSSDKSHLQDRSEAALRLILNRDSDRPLRDELTADIARLVAALPDDVSSGPARRALAKAAEASLLILRAAEKRRVTVSSSTLSPAPAEAKPVAAADSAASYERAASHPRRHPQPAAPEQSRRSALVMMAALLIILAIGLAVGLRGHSDQTVRPLVAQMEAATRGNVPAVNIFGGGLKAAVQGGRTVVTVDGIPPGECVSAGWDLVHKGLLTVNGVTPNRVSAAKLNDICHEGDTATLIWSPKDNNK